jgi:hypothetical protein
MLQTLNLNWKNSENEEKQSLVKLTPGEILVTVVR